MSLQVRQRVAEVEAGKEARLRGDNRAALRHFERALELSRELNDFTGDADAYGTAADCYSDLGKTDKAKEYYNKYIEVCYESPHSFLSMLC